MDPRLLALRVLRAGDTTPIELVYRRAARPSGQALGAARSAAEARLLEAQASLRIAHDALASGEREAAELRRAHDEAVHDAEEERTRALRLVIAHAPEGTVPPGLRESLSKDQRARGLTRALEGRGEIQRSQGGRVASAEQAHERLLALRVERSKALADAQRALVPRRRECAEAKARLTEAQADLERLGPPPVPPR